ncbi:MipA/OmpV family protein [Caballeronia mineralivorans]|nr:MipA/OmpV family protein [Caballeronia mineralivorans]
MATSLPFGQAMAQTSTAPSAAASSTNDQLTADGWRFSLGAGAFMVPKYPGARDYRFTPAPLIGVGYGRFFFGSVPDANVPFGLGAFLYRDDRFRVGVAVSYDFVKPRKESDDAHLHGLGDIDRTAHATLFASYNLEWLSAVAAVSQDIGGKHQGTTASFDLLGAYRPVSQLTLTAGPGVTWASSQYNQTFFGISEADSARSRLPQYNPGSGIAAVRFSVGANYKFNKHWNLGARVVATRLPGAVGSSPVVEKKNQITYGAFANYVF